MMSSHPVFNQLNPARMLYDLRQEQDGRFEKYWENRNHLPAELFANNPRLFFEIGAGTGWFFGSMAEKHPDVHFVAMERCRMRGNRLVRKASRSGLKNFTGFRGNIIPTVMHGIPSESVERLYLLYPCPWPRNSQRRNRWYLHPIMPHLLRILKKDGLMIWASDQKFYIDEAHFACTEFFKMKSLAFGELAPNPYNDLSSFPEGRTKFEYSFRAKGLPCYELIVQKS